MTISPKDLKKIAQLAHLDTEHSLGLPEEISSIMNFVDTLRSVNTEHVTPMFHPIDLHQRLRPDEVTEENCLAELETIASLFEDDLYLVPKVIELGN